MFKSDLLYYAVYNIIPKNHTVSNNFLTKLTSNISCLLYKLSALPAQEVNKLSELITLALKSVIFGVQSNMLNINKKNTTCNSSGTLLASECKLLLAACRRQLMQKNQAFHWSCARRNKTTHKHDGEVSRILHQIKQACFKVQWVTK